MDRRSGNDRRSNVVAFKRPVSKEIIKLAEWFAEYVDGEEDHSTIIITCGQRLKCRIFYAGHAPQYATLMVGELIDKLPVMRAR